MKTVLLVCALFLTGCGWRTEYSDTKTTTGIVNSTYHRPARYSYEPWMPEGLQHRFYSAVYRVELFVPAINTTFTLRGVRDYEQLRQGDKVTVRYREAWRVKYEDEHEVEREFDGYTLDSYTK